MSDPLDSKLIDDPAFQSVLVSCLEALQRGETIDREQLASDHPGYAEAIEQFLDDQDLLEQATLQFMPDHLPKGNTDHVQTIANDSNSPMLTAGDTVRYIGDYEILEEIARGGMGVIFKARQQSLKRVVALKMILAGRLASPADVERFQLEARAAGRLKHPNIVPIHEVGEHRGHHYFTMDLVEGRSLAEMVREETLSPHHAAEIVVKVAEAVEYAHQHGTLHRDLKPANILIDGGGEPHVTDFGLAKLLEVEDADELHELTATGQVLGTPSYMSPEQASGKSALIGPASDIYSLGAILYSCIAGRAPFVAESTVDTIMQVLKKDPVSPRELNPSVPRDLETVCLKCLTKEPHKRYGTAQLMADDLHRYLEGRPVAARPVGRIERGWRWSQRNPVVASLASLIAASLLVGTIVSSALAVRARNAAESERNARQEAEKSEANAKSLAEEMAILADEKSALAEREHAARDRAEAARMAAERSEQETKAAQRRTSRNLYVASMNLAPSAWRNNNIERLLQLLEATQPPYTGGEDLRGFEWQYWWNQCHSDLLTVSAGSAVRDLAISPDGQLFVTAGNGLQLWKAESAEHIRTLLGSNGDHLTVAFSPNGKLIASGGTDSLVYLWDVESGELLNSWEGHSHWVYGLAFHPRGDHLATVSGHSSRGEGRVLVWDVSTGERQRDLSVVESCLFAVTYSPDGQLLVGGGTGEKNIYCWDVESGNKVAEWNRPSAVQSLAFSPDGKRLASSGWWDTIWINDTDTDKRTFDTEAHPGHAPTLAFHPDGTRLVSGGTDQTVRVWDTYSGQLLEQFRGHTARVSAVTFDASRRRVISAAHDQTVKVWGINSSVKESTVLSGNRIYTRDLAFNEDGKRLASVVGNPWNPAATGEIRIWDLSTQTSKVLPPAHKRGVLAVAFSPDGLYFATSGSDGAVLLWDANSADMIRVINEEEAPGWSIAYSPDGRYLAVGFSESLLVWDMVTGEATYRFEGLEGPLESTAFSPNGRYLAGASKKGATVWDLASGVEVRSWRCYGGKDFNTGLAFSLDSELLAFVDSGGFRLVEFQTGNEVLNVNGHSLGINDLTVSPDGKRLATCADDRTVKLWDVATGKEVLTFELDFYPLTLAFSPNGVGLACAGYGRDIVLWDATPRGTNPLRWYAGHKGPITTVTFSPNGERAFSTSGWPAGDNTVRVWDVQTGEEVQRFEGHENNNIDASFLPDGQRVLSGAGDGTLRLWDIATGEEELRLTMPAEGDAVAVTPDGRLGAVGLFDNNCYLFDLKTGEQVRRLSGHTTRILDVDVSPDGSQLISCGDDPFAILWSIDSGEEIRRLDHGSGIDRVIFSPDGQLVLTGGWDDKAILWNVASGEIQVTFIHNGNVADAAFTADGSLLVTACHDNMVYVWDVESGKLLRRLKDHRNWVWSVAISPDDNRILSGGGGAFLDNTFLPGSDFAMRVWDLAAVVDVAVQKSPPRTVTPSRWLHGHEGTVRSLDFSPDGQRAVSATGWPQDDKSLRVWDIATGREIQQFENSTSGSFEARFMPDGKRVLSGADDGHLRMWDISTGVELMSLASPARGEAIALSGDGRYAAIAARDGKCYLFDLKTSEQLRSFVGHEKRLLDVDISPDGEQLLTGGDDSYLILWSIETGEEIRRLEGHAGSVECVRFSPDGKQAVSCGRDGEVILWDLDSGQMIRSFDHSAPVNEALFAADGRVVSACRNGAVYLWDIETGNRLDVLEDSMDSVWCLAVSPDGGRLLSGGGQVSGNSPPPRDFAIRMWEIPSAKRSGEHGEAGADEPIASEVNVGSTVGP
ncbi:protein kinase [Aeoliella sp. ICT_H6.2]|uniref:non-specific serine/threonine protein kinase n=1 Tax=Aeoliella straminimaris TaxID=2954799 RepID=A0A9X2F612_9BACT|nr:protein kinase [Aeoliella straminimaris]MCO6042887.1 protein kinase [Aeoliella straminimaris]